MSLALARVRTVDRIVWYSHWVLAPGCIVQYTQMTVLDCIVRYNLQN
jgi:hypothetical protein